MSLAYWRDICILNFPEFDEEHATILKALEAVYQDLQQVEENYRIQAKLNFLFETTLLHCETEERFMENYGYPDSKKHADQHEELLNNVLNLRLKAEEQEEQLTLDMIHGITAWLSRHSWEYDLQLVQFIQSRRRRDSLLFT